MKPLETEVETASEYATFDDLEERTGEE